MAAILLKVFSAVMSVIVTLSGMFPVAFGNKVYIDPAENSAVIDGGLISSDSVKTPTVITDFETAKSVFSDEALENYDEKFFEEHNLVLFSVTLNDTSYRAFVKSIAEKGDKVEIKYSLLSDGCIAAMIITCDVFGVSVSKNIKTADISGTELFVPFCIHEI